jgi:FMN phosphatase YigB (HAD superfamily)
LLIFDFDGVLIDSLDEVTLTVYNTATGQLVRSPADLPPALAELFRGNRFHVQPIGDGILLMKWCLSNYRRAPERILQPAEYRQIIEAATEDVALRTGQVYETRRKFIDKDANGWIKLHRPFQPLWKELVGRQNRRGFAMVTNKNRTATERLCRHFGLNMPSEDIYSGDNGASKIENMQKVQQRFAKETFYFLDDSLKNLLELDNGLNQPQKKLIPLLADWGYTGSGDRKRALKSGISVLSQADAVALLADLIP